MSVVSIINESIISDSESAVSDTTSFGDICEEISQLIEQCHTLHGHIHNSFETLYSIKQLIENHTNIMVTYNNSVVDFDDVLEELHLKALDNIAEKGYSNFGEQLLSTLDSMTYL